MSWAAIVSGKARHHPPSPSPLDNRAASSPRTPHQPQPAHASPARPSPELLVLENGHSHNHPPASPLKPSVSPLKTPAARPATHLLSPRSRSRSSSPSNSRSRSRSRSPTDSPEPSSAPSPPRSPPPQPPQLQSSSPVSNSSPGIPVVAASESRPPQSNTAHRPRAKKSHVKKAFNHLNHQPLQSQSHDANTDSKQTANRNPPSTPPTPSTSANKNGTSVPDAMWKNPRILAIYRLWTHHVSSFMAHPAHFFGVFVANPVFRQSVFEAGLTFHPDTDPAHPVLINLNSCRFGMAERISALSPPAGIEPRMPTSGLPPTTPLPASASSAAQTNSPQQHNNAIPNHMPPPMPPFFDPSSTTHNFANGEFSPQSPHPIDNPQFVYSPYNAPLDPAVNPHTLSAHFANGMKLGHPSDTESDNVSEGGRAPSSSGHSQKLLPAPKPPKSFSYNGVRTSHRTVPIRDGRRRVVSRVRDIRIPPNPICKHQTEKAKVELIEQINEIFPTITPPPEQSMIREDLLFRLRSIVQAEWPGADVNIYGSAGNGLDLRSADVDMSLYMPKSVAAAHSRDKGRTDSMKVFLGRFATMMEENGVIVLSTLLDARVPVVKMFDPISKLHVDVCANNNLAVRNTDLLRAYAELDERFRYVCILVKLWAKRRDLNDAYHGTLSSYAYALLVIHYLQTLDPPVLPCLQRMVNGQDVPIGARPPREMTDNGNQKMYNTYFDRDVTGKTFKSKNTMPVHELLLGFFHYYAYVFRYRTDLASIRLGVRTSRTERAWDEPTVYSEWEAKKAKYRVALEAARHAMEAREPGNESRGRGTAGANGKSGGTGDAAPAKKERIQFPRRPRLASKHLFCIEDPFDIDHDLSRGMEKAAVTVIRQEMMRAYEIIAGTGDFNEACEEFG